MRRRFSLDELLARPGRVLGTWTQIANADLIDALGAARFDFTIIDCEHGAFGIETAESLIRACEAAGIAPLVRVPRGDTTAIYKALDAGAAGVVVPSNESIAEAEAAIAASRFAPGGQRGACPIVRAADHSGLGWRDFSEAQARNGVILMIETRAGLEHCEAICALPGLKALLLGPFDLSIALGHAGDYRHPEVHSAVTRVLEAAQKAQRPVLVPVFTPDGGELQREIARWASAGIRHFAVGADKIIVVDSLRRYRAAAAE
jgi:4-hydroxy-2-oxoheptanedioate aldolase